MFTFHRKYLDNILEVWHIPSPYHYKSSSIIIPIVVNPLLYILCLLLIICHLYHYELDKGVDIGYCHNHHHHHHYELDKGWILVIVIIIMEPACRSLSWDDNLKKYCNCKQCMLSIMLYEALHWQPTLSKLGFHFSYIDTYLYIYI